MSGEGTRERSIANGIGESNELDVTQELYKAYVSTMSRFRWSVMITTMLSALMLLHMAMEKLSYQEDQLIGYLTIQHERVLEIEKLQKEAAELRQKKQQPGADQDRIKQEYAAKDKELAELQYRDNRARNTLKETSLKDRRIPLLGLPVPANDFLPTISVMLLIFMMAVLLNQWSIEAAVNQIKENVHIPERKQEMGVLLPLHFAFNGLGTRTGDWLQGLALALPAISILIAGLFDILPAIHLVRAQAPGGYVGDLGMVLGRAGMIFGLLICAAIVSVISVHKAINLDRAIRRFRKQAQVVETDRMPA